MTLRRTALRFFAAVGVPLTAACYGPAGWADAPVSTPVPATSPATPPAAPPSPVAPPGPMAPDTTPPLVLVPTDRPSETYKLPSPLFLGQQDLVSGVLDLRARSADTGIRHGVWVNAAELDLIHGINVHGQVRGNLVLQGIAEDPADIPGGRDVQLGEAYILYKLPIETDTTSSVYLKVGQFQIPFGLLAVYDPHLALDQPLYAQSLGLRTDFGIAVSGQFYGLLNYDASITEGSGPNRFVINPKRVISFRLGRTFVTRNGMANVGGSLLTGRLPVTDIETDDPFAVELPPSGRARAYRTSGYVDKSRVAGDATYSFKSFTARGEAMIGADDTLRVYGYYAEGDYGFTPKAHVFAAGSFWHYAQGQSSAIRDGVGLSYEVDTNLVLRAYGEYLRDVPQFAGGRIRHRFTVQALLRF